MSKLTSISLGSSSAGQSLKGGSSYLFKFRDLKRSVVFRQMPTVIAFRFHCALDILAFNPGPARIGLDWLYVGPDEPCF